MSETALKDRKEVLRREAMELPKVVGDKLTERFLSLTQIEHAKTFFLFYGVGKELDTRPLIERLLKDGKRVALPVCLPGRKMETREIKTLKNVIPGRFHIPEPGAECPVVSQDEIDVVLVPNLLCDRDGYRLGYGGGYYDRWLADYSGFSVAICPPERLVDELPREPFDIPVDLVLSEI